MGLTYSEEIQQRFTKHVWTSHNSRLLSALVFFHQENLLNLAIESTRRMKANFSCLILFSAFSLR